MALYVHTDNAGEAEVGAWRYTYTQTTQLHICDWISQIAVMHRVECQRTRTDAHVQVVAMYWCLMTEIQTRRTEST